VGPHRRRDRVCPPLDEPFASLDLDNQRRTLALIGALARRHGLSIVFSSHHPDHVFAVANTVVVLRRGEVTAYGSVDHILTPERLCQTYGVPVEVLEIKQTGGTRRHAIPLL
jgi:iron complex transport system ATP-binding protein